MDNTNTNKNKLQQKVDKVLQERGEVYRGRESFKEDLRDALRHCLGVYGEEGSYVYWLTRCKTAFAVGTMTIEDFKEFEDQDIEEFTDFLVRRLQVYLNMLPDR